jgi:hypothetical protein
LATIHDFSIPIKNITKWKCNSGESKLFMTLPNIQIALVENFLTDRGCRGKFVTLDRRGWRAYVNGAVFVPPERGT